MGINKITYYKNQKELAKGINNLVDSYWDLKFSQEDFIESLKEIETNNKSLLYKDNDYTSIIKQRLGAKRLRVLDAILKN